MEVKRYNEALMDVLETMADIRAKEGEVFKAKAFKNAHDKLVVYGRDIRGVGDLKGIPGFGESVIAICKEFIETGRVGVIQEFRNNPIQVFADIYGVGPKMSAKLVSMGFKSIADLRARGGELLNDKQVLGLRYYEDIQQRIPRGLVAQYEKAFRACLPTVKEGDGGVFMEIVGSYRRGLATSGDIDVIFTYREGAATEGGGGGGAKKAQKVGYEAKLIALFNQFIENMIQRGLIERSHILAQGDSKCLVIAKLPGGGDVHYRRIDFLCAPASEYAASLLYFTGSKYFNTVMRQWAVDHGLTMNEHGIYHLTAGHNKGALVNVLFETEADIFQFLGLVYKAPMERRDGRDVVPVGTLVDLLRKSGVGALSKGEQEALLHAAKDAYYNRGAAIMTDSEFDLLADAVLGRGGVVGTGAPALGAAGAMGTMGDGEGIEDEFVGGVKATLPYYAPSLDKIKPDTGALIKWMKKYRGPYVVSCKLDGCSCLIARGREAGAEVRMYTRGNGAIGTDITHLIPYIRGIQQAIKGLKAGECVRGELIISKADFEAMYADVFANIRNMITGTLGRKLSEETIKRLSSIHFVAYEVVAPAMKPSDQMLFLQRGGWEVVWYTVVAGGGLTNEGLSNLLVKMREEYVYEVDGLVVANDAVYARGDDKDKNPEHAFAFKMILADQMAEVICTSVSWNVSKDGYLKPQVNYEPVIIKGVECKNATGFNAAYIRDNGVGVGAVIVIMRSGDVIPYILKVLKRAVVAGMPTEAEFGAMHWNETGVDLVLDNLAENSDVLAKLILRFFRTIETRDLAEGNIAKLIDAGYNSVPRILAMKLEDWMKVAGFGKTMATKLYRAVQESIKAASLVQIMAATNLFGRGFSEKKIGAVMAAVPGILGEVGGVMGDEAAVVGRLLEVPGIGEKSAVLFARGIPAFLAFMSEAGLEGRLGEVAVVGASMPVSGVKNSGFPTDKDVVFSGFRDKELKAECEMYGIRVADNITKKTGALLVRNVGEKTNKVAVAQDYGIPIMTVEQFRSVYLPIG